jgi:hypothetical protein
MRRVSLHFDDMAIAVLGEHAASGRAFPAGGGIPGCITWDDIFWGDEVGD